MKVGEFNLNYYCHKVLLLMRADDGYAGQCLSSREEVTQGDLLEMILYGIGMMSLTLQLKVVVPTYLQLWYADNAEAGIILKILNKYLGY